MMAATAPSPSAGDVEFRAIFSQAVANRALLDPEEARKLEAIGHRADRAVSGSEFQPLADEVAALLEKALRLIGGRA